MNWIKKSTSLTCDGLPVPDFKEKTLCQSLRGCDGVFSSLQILLNSQTIESMSAIINETVPKEVFSFIEVATVINNAINRCRIVFSIKITSVHFRAVHRNETGSSITSSLSVMCHLTFVRQFYFK